MIRSTLSRSVSACALSLVVFSYPASAQEALPTIDIGDLLSAQPGTAPGSQRGAGAAKETGYLRSTSSGATKTNTPLIDTPASIQIIPHEVIADEQALTTQEAVKNVSGVQATGAFFDQYLIRGFKSGYGETFRNGLKLGGTSGAEEIAFTDRVEVIKGPASMLYGRIEPGGFINVVTKRPQEQFKAEINEQFGSWGLSRTTLDVTGAANAANTVLYRVMGAYDHADSFVNFEHRDNAAVALFLTFKPTSNLEINTQFEHYQRRQTALDGVGAVPVHLINTNGKPFVIPGYNDRPLNLPRNFSMSDPGIWNNFPFVIRRTLFAYDWTYKFDEKWALTNRFHYSDANDTEGGLANYAGFDGTNINRSLYAGASRNHILSTNLDLRGEFMTGPIKHMTLIGIDWFTRQKTIQGSDSYGYPLNVYAPIYGNIDAQTQFDAYVSASNVLWRTTERNFGVYVQDQASFWDDRIHILLGGRWDKAEIGAPKEYGDGFSTCFPFCSGFPGNNYKDKPKISPRAGILFKLTEDTSFYGSYVRSFGANNGVSKDGATFPPEEGLQWEAGVKKLWLDGKVMTSVALFDLGKKNVLERDPFNPGYSRAVGLVKSRGVEFDVSGNLTENLSVIASYTFDSVKIINDGNNGDVGKRYNGAAPHVGNIFAKWDTAPGLSEGWEFGGGVYAIDQRWGSNDNSWKLPGYVKFDVMSAYRTVIEGHSVKFQLNIKNLTDRRYFENSDGYQFSYYGQPRTFLGSVNFQW
jgi:iron complex outermembrane recepter protein